MYNKTLSSLVVAIATFVSIPSTQLNAQNASGNLDREAVAVSQSAPVYSYDLRHDEIQGKVVVSFIVSPSGEVSNAAIVESTQRRLNGPTLRAVNKWKFVPAAKAGAPVASRVVQTVVFVMNG
jgi:protein TonB